MNEMPEIRGAVAKGWCSSENETKIMDPTLAEAISKEVYTLIAQSPKEPFLGCATTRELLAEITARIEVSGNLDYRTIDSD